MRLAVIGANFLGVVTAACFAEMGHEVVCVDADEEKIDALDQGRLPFYESGLEDLLRRNCQGKRLLFTTDLAAAVRRSLIIFIAVDAPEDVDGSINVSAVMAAAQEIGQYLRDYAVIVVKTTVPVGTAAQVRQVVAAALAQRDEKIEFDVVINPGFLKEGTAIDNFMKPDRIVIGCDNVRVAELMKQLYAPFVRTHHPIIVMDTVSAELTKYAANAFLATKISFINEIANICALTGANIEMVRQGIGADPRIGKLFLFPGLGYGGARFPKDMKTLIYTAKSLNYYPRLLTAVEVINWDQRRLFVQKICHYFNDNLHGRLFAVWGLSYKPGTDDIQEAPALTVIFALVDKGALIKAYDPQAMKSAQRCFGEHPSIKYAVSSYDALQDADALIINTEWTIFRAPDFDLMKKLMKAPVIFDGRNLYDPEKMKTMGFNYFFIGSK